MSRFFIGTDNIFEDKIVINGSDVNHIKNVLRHKIGDVIFLSDSAGNDYECVIEAMHEDIIELSITNKTASNSELSVQIVLFQGLPKGDKMELIIQKNVELGVSKIIPVNNERCVAKLDDKKAKNRVERWNKISESAAKQSGRSLIPEIGMPISYKEALNMCKDFDMVVFPYENADGMKHSGEVIKKAANCKKVAVFIGPEGGFSQAEVDKAIENNAEVVSLGKRILRTETAGMTIMSLIMFENELINE